MRLAGLPRSGFLPAALGLEHGRGRRDEKPRERKSILRSVLRHVQGRPFWAFVRETDYTVR